MWRQPDTEQERPYPAVHVGRSDAYLTSLSTIGLVFYHAYLVYDAKNNFYMASNPVPLKLVK